MVAHQLPENAFYGRDGKLYHKVKRMTEGGTVVEMSRPLALTIEEARNERKDFYHPTLGLIWEGYKLAADRTPDDIMQDMSVGGQVPPGGTPVPVEKKGE